MFQGSANVPRGEHFKLVTSHGGQLNGTTNEDRTNYFEMMPRSELPLALWLEADRLKSLDISEKNFENQRKVVEEEFRMRVENAAYVPASIRLEELVFQGYWPYEHPAIGNMHDLDAAQLEWVRAFHDDYYAPNNAVLSISGDFDADEAKSLAHALLRQREAPRDPAVRPRPDARADAAARRRRRGRARQAPGTHVRVGDSAHEGAGPLRARDGCEAPRGRRELAALPAAGARTVARRSRSRPRRTATAGRTRSRSWPSCRAVGASPRSWRT